MGGRQMISGKKNKIGICHIITRLDAGGAAENTLSSVCGLDSDRFAVSLIYGNTLNPLQPWIDKAKSRGVELIYMPEMIREISPWIDFKTYFRLKKILKKLNPKIVHTHSSKAGVLGRWAARSIKGAKLVHTPHGHIFYGYYGVSASSFFKSVERRAASFTDRLIGLTRLEVDQHVEKGVGRREQFRVVHSGVDVEKFATADVDRAAVRKRLRVPEGGLCIGSAGRLAEVKNFSLLLEALEILDEKQPEHYQLVIPGEGALKGILLDKSMELGLQDRFYLPGWFDNMENYYPAFDVFALSSKNEGMGRVLVEAMAAGVPVVATAVGGVPELLGDGEYGRLVPPGDAKAMAAAIQELADSERLRQEFSEKGRRRAEDYTVEKMNEKLLGVYEELV
jgi:glycosyltransferase involved in cell wall biosynthesis